jgi:hypothetical protein
MADKNRNGIPDQYESSYGRTSPGKKSDLKNVNEKAPGIAGAWQDFLQGPLRGGANLMGSSAAFLGSQPNPAKGDNIGDQLFGVPSVKRPVGTRGRAGGGEFGTPGGADPAMSEQSSFLDFLAQAEGLIDQYGIGGGGGPGVQAVDYSPAINQANQSRDRNSAYLDAIYNQLRGEMTKDRGNVEQNFGNAIDRSQEITKEAQTATQSAYGAAQQQASQEAQALGMQSAAASINTERPGLMAQAADAVADQASTGQNAQIDYNNQQANALEHNSNVQNASQFAQVRSQGDLNASLAERLAELQVMQSEANAQASNANAANAGNSGARGEGILSLAQSLYGDQQNQSQQDFENQIAAIKAQGGAGQQAPQFNLQQLMQGQQESGLQQGDYIQMMKLLAQLNG